MIDDHHDAAEGHSLGYFHSHCGFLSLPRANGRYVTTTLVVSCLRLQSGCTEDAVKHENFKTCAQSGFCKRNRAYADSVTAQASSWTSPYQLDSTTIRFSDGALKAVVLKTTTDRETIRLPLNISFYESGAARVTLDEEKRRDGQIELRHGSTARKERYNEVDAWALVGGLSLSKSAKIVNHNKADLTKVGFGKDGSSTALIRHAPFSVEFQRGGETHIAFNQRGLMNLEHWRPKKDGEATPEASFEDESTWWDESFGGNTDTKPRGPESVGLDIVFPGYDHVFGIPEHAGPLSLRETR